MTHNFCTLFDKKYLFKGLALHKSLERTAGDYTLWILCMDETACEVLGKMALPNVRLLPLDEFEDAELLEVKPTRTPVEYCWTCTPSLLLYLLEHQPEMESITYLDADLYFFSDPAPLFDEVGDGSVAIIGHRYSPRWQKMAVHSGTYNVEYMTFKNDERGLAALRWWRDRCIEWCYQRVEDGRFGDQKYLDDWPERFEGIVVLHHAGAGLAPWNIESHRLTKRRGVTLVDGEPLVFYHFHQLAILNDRGRHKPASHAYRLTQADRTLVYRPYAMTIVQVISETRAVAPGYDFGIEHRTLGDELSKLLNLATRAFAKWRRDWSDVHEPRPRSRRRG